MAHLVAFGSVGDLANRTFEESRKCYTIVT